MDQKPNRITEGENPDVLQMPHQGAAAADVSKQSAGHKTQILTLLPDIGLPGLTHDVKAFLQLPEDRQGNAEWQRAKEALIWRLHTQGTASAKEIAGLLEDLSRSSQRKAA